MIEKLLSKNLICLNYKCENWEEVIYKAGELLLANGKIEETYITAMIETVKTLGAYIVIEKGIAMPHARPESGVKENGIAILTLENSIIFGNPDYDPVKLVLAICANDGNEHLALIQDLCLILENENFIDMCLSCVNEDEVLNLIKSYITN